MPHLWHHKLWNLNLIVNCNMHSHAQHGNENVKGSEFPRFTW